MTVLRRTRSRRALDYLAGTGRRTRRGRSTVALDLARRERVPAAARRGTAPPRAGRGRSPPPPRQPRVGRDSLRSRSRRGGAGGRGAGTTSARSGSSSSRRSPRLADRRRARRRARLRHERAWRAARDTDHGQGRDPRGRRADALPDRTPTSAARARTPGAVARLRDAGAVDPRQGRHARVRARRDLAAVAQPARRHAHPGRLERRLGHRACRDRHGPRLALHRHPRLVRVPAALSGVVGLKPTYGTVPTEGVVPPGLDDGPRRRDRRHCRRHGRRCLTSLRDLPPMAAGRDGRGRRPEDSACPKLRFEDIDPDVEAVSPRGESKDLVAAGATTIDLETPGEPDFTGANAGGMITSRCEAATFHKGIGTDRDLYWAEVRDQLNAADDVLATDYLQAQRYRGVAARADAQGLRGRRCAGDADGPSTGTAGRRRRGLPHDPLAQRDSLELRRISRRSRFRPPSRPRVLPIGTAGCRRPVLQSARLDRRCRCGGSRAEVR